MIDDVDGIFGRNITYFGAGYRFIVFATSNTSGMIVLIKSNVTVALIFKHCSICLPHLKDLTFNLVKHKEFNSKISLLINEGWRSTKKKY